MTNKFYFAPPREGKTFVVVKEAIDIMKNKRRVYSNFPIITPSGFISRVWKPEFIYKNIQNAMVLMDEAQRDFDSQEHRSLDNDEDIFFATSGHNGIEIRIISQNLTRVTKAIRDRCNEFVFVQKGLPWPFIKDREGKWGRPLYFKTTSYLTMEDLAAHDSERVYTKSRVWYSREVALAYDTHYFKKQGEIFIPQTWMQELIEMKADMNEALKYLDEPKRGWLSKWKK
jgi:hypothetical protein